MSIKIPLPSGHTHDLASTQFSLYTNLQACTWVCTLTCSVLCGCVHFEWEILVNCFKCEHYCKLTFLELCNLDHLVHLFQLNESAIYVFPVHQSHVTLLAHLVRFISTQNSYIFRKYCTSRKV